MFISDRYCLINYNIHSLFSNKFFSISFKILSTTPNRIYVDQEYLQVLVFICFCTMSHSFVIESAKDYKVQWSAFRKLVYPNLSANYVFFIQ